MLRFRDPKPFTLHPFLFQGIGATQASRHPKNEISVKQAEGLALGKLRGLGCRPNLGAPLKGNILCTYIYIGFRVEGLGFRV